MNHINTDEESLEMKNLFDDPGKTLQKYCRLGDLKKLEQVWSLIDINTKFTLNVDDNILESTCYSGNIKCVEFIIKKIVSHYDIYLIKDNLQSAFNSACKSGNIEIVKYIYSLCGLFKIKLSFLDEDIDILEYSIIYNFIDIVKFVLYVDKFKDLGLKLEEEDNYTIYSHTMIVNKISYLFMEASRNDNPEMAKLLITCGFDITVYKQFIQDVILDNKLKTAKFLFEVDPKNKNRIDYNHLLKNIAKTDNDTLFEWLIKEGLVTEDIKIELFNNSIKFRSNKILKYMLERYNIDIDYVSYGYLELLTSQINNDTHCSSCVLLKNYLIPKKIDLYKITLGALKLCVKKLNVTGIMNIINLNVVSENDIKDIIHQLAALNLFDHRVEDIFNMVFPKVKDMFSDSDSDIVDLINMFSINGYNTINTQLGNLNAINSYKKESINSTFFDYYNDNNNNNKIIDKFNNRDQYCNYIS